MGTNYIGSMTVGDLFPKLKEAVDALTEQYEFTDDQKAELQKKVDAEQRRLQGLQSQVDNLTSILDSASELVDTAHQMLLDISNLLTSLGSTLSQSGVRLFTYSGKFYAMGPKLSMFAVNNSLNQTGIGANDCVGAFIIMVSDGGLLNNIKPLIGGWSDSVTAVDNISGNVADIWQYFANGMREYEEENGQTATIPTTPPDDGGCFS